MLHRLCILIAQWSSEKMYEFDHYKLNCMSMHCSFVRLFLSLNYEKRQFFHLYFFRCRSTSHQMLYETCVVSNKAMTHWLVVLFTFRPWRLGHNPEFGRELPQKQRPDPLAPVQGGQAGRGGRWLLCTRQPWHPSRRRRGCQREHETAADIIGGHFPQDDTCLEHQRQTWTRVRENVLSPLSLVSQGRIRYFFE